MSGFFDDAVNALSTYIATNQVKRWVGLGDEDVNNWSANVTIICTVSFYIIAYVFSSDIRGTFFYFKSNTQNKHFSRGHTNITITRN